MSRSPELLFVTEYIKNVLYFATVRQGKVLKSTPDTHYFCIDNELVYENYYSDFGPLNLGCVFKYCKILNEKLKLYLNKQSIVHYTSVDPKKKANSAFLLGCYGVLYLSLSPRDAIKPLQVHGQSYRPFQDATQGESSYTISLMDCLQAIKKARDLGFFNFQDFDYEEYDRLDKIQGGDLNWIIPGKFLAFIGPVDYSVSLYHPPEMYIDYFLENDVKIVIRLNKRLYDGNVFNKAGIVHYDLFFPDGSCPPRHTLFKFLQIAEDSNCAIGVHCKAGLGRTGSLIGCYLIKHYRMLAREAIGWMRICRPGSVIGHQQEWLEQLEAWLIKQGNLYRRRMYQDTEKLPIHQFGIYSTSEKVLKKKPLVFKDSRSPSPPMQRQIRSQVSPHTRPQASRVREDYQIALDKDEREEIFLTSCDLTVVKPPDKTMPLKGCVMKTDAVSETDDDRRSEQIDLPFWKKYFCCQLCFRNFNNGLWMLAVRCARITPNRCNTSKFCGLLDMVAPHKAPEKDQYEFRVRISKLSSSQKVQQKGDSTCPTNPHSLSRRSSGAGEPRVSRPPSRSSTSKSQTQRNSIKQNEPSSRNLSGFQPIPQYRPPGPSGTVLKTVNDAKNFLMRNSIYNQEPQKHLKTSINVLPNYSFRVPNYVGENITPSNMAHVTPSTFTTASRITTQAPCRRRLGRSPSPPQIRVVEQNRATNTPSPIERFLAKDASKSMLKEAFSRLKLPMPRDGSIGAASLGARRDAPAPLRAPSVRSDERPTATQGDMLNSIKFQRRFRESLQNYKLNPVFNDKVSLSSRKSSIKNIEPRTNAGCYNRPSFSYNLAGLQDQDYGTREKTVTSPSKAIFNSSRPASPKSRRNSHTYY